MTSLCVRIVTFNKGRLGLSSIANAVICQVCGLRSGAKPNCTSKTQHSIIDPQIRLGHTGKGMPVLLSHSDALLTENASPGG